MDDLVKRCQQGDLAAFAELFGQCETRVYRLALTILRNEQDAEDAVQDVFLRVFEQINRYRGQAAFTTWLTTITVNSCRDKLRRKKVRQAFSLDWLRHVASQHRVPEQVDQRQERRKLWQAVDQLDEKYRLPAILHYYERLSCDEVATVLNIRTSTVYSRLNTARLKLRALMAEEESQWQGGLDRS